MSRQCAYCGGGKKLTREHIFSDCLLELTNVDSARISRNPGKFVNPNLKIKDVCKKCNNECMSLLDKYICKSYESFLGEYIFEEQRRKIDYDFDMLARWLMKTSYNAARASGDEYAEGISNYTNYMLGKEGRPKYISIVVLLSKPFKPTKRGVNIDSISDPDIVVKNGERLIAPRVMGAKSVSEYEMLSHSISYMVVVNSFNFVLSIFPNNKFEAEQFVKKITSREYQLIPQYCNKIELDPPDLDFMDVAKRFGILE